MQKCINRDERFRIFAADLSSEFTMRVTALFAFLVSFATISFAHITGVLGPTTYKATASSNYPLTFTTINGPITK